MTLDLFLTAATATFVETTLLVAVVLAFDRWAPTRFLKERHDLAAAVIFLTPVLFLLTFTPSGVGTTADVFAAGEASRSAALAGSTAMAGAAGATTASGPQPSAVQTSALPSIGLGPLFVSLWIIGAVAMFARLIRDVRLFDALRVGAKTVAPQEGLALSEGIEIRRSPAIASPMLGGVLKPVILIPDDFRLDASSLPVLEHEIAHWRRGDPLIELAARIVTALFWWNAPLHALKPVIGRSREALCDAEAARRTGAPERLAEALIDVAARALSARAGSAPSLSLPVAGRGSALADRVRRLTNGEAQKTRRPMTTLPVILSVLTVFSVVAAPQTGSAGYLEVSFLQADAALEYAGRDDDEGRDNPLYWAARRGDVKAVRRLLGEGADPDRIAFGDGTPLMGAVRSGEIGIVELLLEAGADPDLASRGDGTPLIVAADREETEMVRVLLAAGADPDLASPGEGAPLIAAAGAGSLPIIDLLLEAGADPDIAAPRDGNPLIAAALHGETAAVRRLLAAGADPNAYVYRDETPLINAAQAGRLDVAEILVEAGADVSLTVKTAPDDPGGPYRSPLSEAERKGHDDLVRWLKARGAEHRPASPE